MLNFTAGELITLLVLLPLVGGVIGYVIAGDRMRRHSGGKTPVELKREFDAYQQGVGEHFQHSAELLQQMTQQYREIYTHMAHGAAELCGDGERSAEVEALKRLSLALDDAAAVPAMTAAPDSETAEPVAAADTESSDGVSTEAVESVDAAAAAADDDEQLDGVAEMGETAADTLDSDSEQAAKDGDKTPSTNATSAQA